MKKTLFLFSLLLGAFAANAFSPDIDGIESAWVEKKYPAGSVKNVDEAKKILAEIEKARSYSEQLADYSTKRCSETFFVNRCKDNVRRAKIRAERRFIAVEVEAKRHVRKADIEAEKARQAKRDDRRAAGPKDPFAKSSPKKKAEPPTSATHAQTRAKDIKKREGKMQERRAAETENLKKSDAREAQHKARIAEREDALKRRAEKRAKRENKK